MTSLIEPSRGETPVEAFERHRAALVAARRRMTLVGGGLFAVAFVVSTIVGEFSPLNLAAGLPKIAAYVDGTLPVLRGDHLMTDLGEWYWGIDRWLRLLFDTIVMGFVATLMGVIGAFALCFPASRNLMPTTWIYFVTRRLMELARAVPELVYALIFVFAFGLGPLAGVLAIGLHTMGALGKLFSEVNENVEPGPLDGVRAAGGSWLETMRFGVVPQVLPNFASYALLRFEINVRAASVIGLVGAGGIGEELYFVVRQFEYVDISAIVLLILLTVSAIDISCERLRHGLIGDAAVRAV